MITPESLAIAVAKDAAAQSAAKTQRRQLQKAMQTCLDAGMSQYRAAQILGVSRPTIKVWSMQRKAKRDA